MGNWPLIVVAVLHGAQMVASALKADWPIAMTMAGFTVADIGILFTAR